MSNLVSCNEHLSELLFQLSAGCVKFYWLDSYFQFFFIAAIKAKYIVC